MHDCTDDKELLPRLPIRGLGGTVTARALVQWGQVSEDLGGSRSALECLARSQYLRKLKGGSKAWSPQEVEVLKESYARHVCRGSFWKVNAPHPL